LVACSTHKINEYEFFQTMLHTYVRVYVNYKYKYMFINLTL